MKTIDEASFIHSRGAGVFFPNGNGDTSEGMAARSVSVSRGRVARHDRAGERREASKLEVNHEEGEMHTVNGSHQDHGFVFSGPAQSFGSGLPPGKRQLLYAIGKRIAFACHRLFASRGFTSVNVRTVAFRDSDLADALRHMESVCADESRASGARLIGACLRSASGVEIDGLRLGHKVDSGGGGSTLFRFLPVVANRLIQTDLPVSDVVATNGHAAAAHDMTLEESTARIEAAVDRLGTRLLDYFGQVWGASK